jgi:hypothetical protein
MRDWLPLGSKQATAEKREFRGRKISHFSQKSCYENPDVRSATVRRMRAYIIMAGSLGQQAYENAERMKMLKGLQ